MFEFQQCWSLSAHYKFLSLVDYYREMHSTSKKQLENFSCPNQGKFWTCSAFMSITIYLIYFTKLVVSFPKLVVSCPYNYWNDRYSSYRPHSSNLTFIIVSTFQRFLFLYLCVHLFSWFPFLSRYLLQQYLHSLPQLRSHTELYNPTESKILCYRCLRLVHVRTTSALSSGRTFHT